MKTEQQINNTNNTVDTQINAPHSTFNYSPKTRLQKKFEKLQEEVRNDIRYESFIDDFKAYNTMLDGVGLEQKLQDAGFSIREILRALVRKEKYSKRVIEGEMFQYQQEIDVEIFSVIDINFDTYVYPMIVKGADKSEILDMLQEKVIDKVMDLINKNGEFDDHLNYNLNDIYGMVYFLTGKCHLNWKDYDNI
jgi:uncharacterized protein Smg (DUF494 family)